MESILLGAHVAISLLALLTGAVVVAGLLAGRYRGGWTAWFLWSTGLTCLSGFLLPIPGFTPAVGTSIAGLVTVAIASWAVRRHQLSGGWGTAFVVSAVITEYFNVLVLVAQGFLHIGLLHQLAPAGTEPPFVIAQAIVFASFIAIGLVAARRFRAARFSRLTTA